MCSFFTQKIMEKDQGDLADIVRGSGGVGAAGGISNDPVSYWQIPSEPMAFPPEIEEPSDNFGDPFSSMQDPLLHEFDLAASGYFHSSNNNCSSSLMKTTLEDESSVTAGTLLAQSILEEEMRRPCNIFSRMLQISPNSKMPISPREINPAITTTTSPRAIKTSSLVSASDHMVNASSSGSCSVDNGSVQISSARNPSIKRRKSQAKKVVCIPAPAAANSRPSGEVVPSDLWAWRKYGQKPIKGSPYPRGYYRCSSSKGCSARKQVERSRTDPNMLVITYTSEHNHPWPTQRNALAGSTRSQPPKNNNNHNSASRNMNNTSSPKTSNPKEEPKENSINNDNDESMTSASDSIIMSSSVKEEMGESSDQKTTTVEVCDGEIYDHSGGLNINIHQSYRPVMANIHHDQSFNQQADDLFADLGELEPDPLNLLFSQGFAEGKGEEAEGDNKALIDPFSLFDWSANNSSSFGEAAGRGL